MQVIDLIDFILLNRGTTTFMGYDEYQIGFLVKEGIENGTLFYSTNSLGNIDGMILANVHRDEKRIFVTENLSMNLKNLGIFAARALRQWPGYRIEAVRHKTLFRKYNTEKLYKKLICH